MVIATVGVVSVPSGLIANGFVTLVLSKAKQKAGNVQGDLRDDWYEHCLRKIRTEEIPLSRWGLTVDEWQIVCGDFGIIHHIYEVGNTTISSFDIRIAC